MEPPRAAMLDRLLNRVGRILTSDVARELVNLRFDRRDQAWLIVMGRLKPGWTLAWASEHLRAISPGLMQATLPTGYSRDSLDHYLQFHLEAVAGDHRFDDFALQECGQGGLKLDAFPA